MRRFQLPESGEVDVNGVRLSVQGKTVKPPEDAQYLPLVKARGMMDAYADFFDKNPNFAPKSVLELGIFAGGSVAYWHEALQPEAHAAVDITNLGDSEYFKKYKQGKNIKTYWQTSQSDANALRRIVNEDLGGKVDLVLDDASHQYELSKQSFEILFPFVTPGSYYIIEDWSWHHWTVMNDPNHPWFGEDAPTELIFQLIEIVGSRHRPSPIAHVDVYDNFVAIQRGTMPLGQDFKLQSLIQRRPHAYRHVV